MDDEMLKIYAYVSISSYRRKTVKVLEYGDKTPTEIAKDSNNTDITSQFHEWFSLGPKTYFYWRQINKCIYKKG